MIDTITLRLDESQFKIINHNKFSPCTYNFFNPPYVRMGNRGYLDAYQNPTKKELLDGTYKPQLTLRKRWNKQNPQIYLYIQFSAPKLLFGNNFDELKNSDLDKVILELESALYTMGVMLRPNALENAKVVKIHYARNIILPDYIIPYIVINEVRKADISLLYEVSEKDYRNEGHSFRFHTNEFELIIYDKKKDLQKAKKSDKKSIENDNAIQLNLFDRLNIKKPFEVLRLELRLNTQNKIKRETGIDKDLQILKALFRSDLSIKLLKKFWQEILKNYRVISYDTENKENFLANFIINNPKVKLTNALAICTAIELFKRMGSRKFRNLVECKYSKFTWYALIKSFRKYNINGKLPDHFQAISDSLEFYKPLYLKKYEDYIDIA